MGAGTPPHRSLLRLGAAAAARAFTTLPQFSLSGPYTAFDSEGMRRTPGWALGGTAAFHENFLRLTNDRQSKRCARRPRARAPARGRPRVKATSGSLPLPPTARLSRAQGERLV